MAAASPLLDIDRKRLDEALGPRPGRRAGKAKAPARAKGPKPEPPKPAPAAAKYPPLIVEAAVRASAIRAASTSKHVGPAQLQRVLDAVRERAEGDLTAEAVVAASGLKSLKALKQVAAGEGSREDLAAMRPLADAIGDPYCRGAWLAAELVAVAEALGPRP